MYVFGEISVICRKSIEIPVKLQSLFLLQSTLAIRGIRWYMFFALSLSTPGLHSQQLSFVKFPSHYIMRIPLLRVLTVFINKIFACCRLQHLGSRQKNNVSVEFVITGKIDIKKYIFCENQQSVNIYVKNQLNYDVSN